MATPFALVDEPGYRVTWEFDHTEGCYVLAHHQDVRPVVDSIQRLASMNEHSPGNRFFRHAATIPNAVIYAWMQEGIDIFNPDHTAAITRKLNDIDYAKLRPTGRWRL